MNDTIEFSFEFAPKGFISITRSGLLKSQSRLITFFQENADECEDKNSEEYFETVMQLECAKYIFEILLKQNGGK